MQMRPAHNLPPEPREEVLLDRESLVARREGYLVRGGATKADVWIAALPDGRRLLIKDFESKRPLVRLWGRVQISREVYFLGRLSGLDCVPKLLGRIDRYAFAQEYIAGWHLHLIRRSPLIPNYLAQLRAGIDAIHGLGVVHNDLRGRENVLVTKAERRVVIVDWAGAVHLDRGSWWQRVLFRPLRLVDEGAWVKWKGMLAPQSVSAEDRRLVGRLASWRRLWPFNRKVRANPVPKRSA